MTTPDTWHAYAAAALEREQRREPEKPRGYWFADRPLAAGTSDKLFKVLVAGGWRDQVVDGISFTWVPGDDRPFRDHR